MVRIQPTLARVSADLPRIAILGAGSMGGAILAGVVESGRARSGIVVTNRTAAKADAIRFDGVESIALERDPDGNRTALRGARIVLVGVKPAMVPGLLAEVADAVEPGAIVVSLAAGVPTATMEAAVPGRAVIRSMPNTPAFVRRGVTGLAAGTSASGLVYEASIVGRLWNEFGGDNSATVVNAGAALPTFQDDFSGVFGQVGVKLDLFNIATNWSAFITGDYRFNSDYQSLGGKIGARTRW